MFWVQKMTYYRIVSIPNLSSNIVRVNYYTSKVLFDLECDSVTVISLKDVSMSGRKKKYLNGFKFLNYVTIECNKNTYDLHFLGFWSSNDASIIKNI